MVQQTTTLSKLVELFRITDDIESFESIVKGARYIQKSLELLGLGSDLPESKLLEVSKRFCDKGVYVHGDLSFASPKAQDSEQFNVNVTSFAKAAAASDQEDSSAQYVTVI
jgi:hypothetical protein